jgi:5-methylcytosine-specific restriction endonuclease McrA
MVNCKNCGRFQGKQHACPDRVWNYAKVECVCLYCNSKFLRSPALIGKYCSKQCTNKDKIGKKRPNAAIHLRKVWIKKECLACSKEFKVTPCRSNKALYCSLKCRPSWNEGLRSEKSIVSEIERTRFANTVRKQVIKRDNYICQLCGGNEDLQVDHIQSWKEYVELRFNMDNCRTLCKACHYLITVGRPIPDKKMSWGHVKKEVNFGL